MQRNNLLLAVFFVAAITFTLTACGTGNTNNNTQSGKQAARAYLDQNESSVVDVTVDLSDGWSVEFARGAVYLYDSEIKEGKECNTMLITISKEVYEDYMSEAMADEAHKEADDGIYYTDSEGQGVFLASLDDAAYVKISTKNKDEIKAVVSRFSLALEP